MTLRQGTRLDHYEIHSPLGAGGMGEVYRARDTRLGREVALKVLPEAVSREADRQRRFELEASSASELNHPNVLAVYHVGTYDGTSFIVTELLEGETLRERLAAGPLLQRKAVEYASQIARGLAAAHRREIVHRDLKPENVFVTSDGVVKILDFGLAKRTVPAGGVGAEEPTVRVNTTPGAVMGTPGYMSPEQAAGGRVDHRSDIFSFGCVLYEMLAGRRAFSGASAVETMNAAIKEEPPELSAVQPGVAPALARVVSRCLEKRPEDRFQSASDLAFALDALSGQTTVSGAAAAQTVAGEAVRPRLRERIAWLAACCLLLAAALAFAALYFRRAPASAAPLVRFTIALPENTVQIGPPTVSPDGSRVVFRLNTPGVRDDRLWLRALDSTEAQPLAGTEGGVQPFWSPDGRSIGFFTPGNLSKLELSGGPAQTLTSAEGNMGGTWGRDGVILFSQHGGTGGLYRVSASGGEPAAVTTLDPSRRDVSHAWPYFLPDGRHFLFLARSVQRENSAIYVGSLDSKETKRLVVADSSMAYAPPGYLLYVRENTLVAHPFDADRLELTGDPFPVAQEVSANWANARAMFSVSAGGVLAYRTGAMVNTQIVWLDRGGQRLAALEGQPGRYTAPRLSPDEKRVAFERTDPQPPGNSDVWLLDTARGSSSRFTFGSLDEGSPVWSPDGGQIVFYANREGSTGLYRKPAAGGGEAGLLFDSPEPKFVGDWSPDGRFILFQQLSPLKHWDVWLLPLEGERKPVPLVQTNFTEIQSCFSPDGKWIAYTSSESGQWQVYVQSFPDGKRKLPASTNGGAQPRWRSDGRELYYLTPDRKLMAVEMKGDGDSFEAGVPRPLFEMRGTGSFPGGGSYDVARDGKRFLIRVPVQEEEDSHPVTVVLNWTAGLKR